MSSPHPARLPASVYRRRRIVVGLSALAIVVAVVLLIVAVVTGAGSGKSPSARPSDTPAPTSTSTTPAPEDEVPLAADGSTPCPARVLTVKAVTDKSSYAAGEFPLVSMEITNTGTAACTVNAGTDAQAYAITSGSDPIWSSKDCQVDSTPYSVILQPGVPASTTPFAWERTRSSATTCEGDRPEVTAEGATYRLAVALGDVPADADAPFILN